MSKRFKKLINSSKEKKIETIEEANKKVKLNCTTKFDESIDVSLKLNLKKKKEEISLRTTVNLPNGNGKKVKIAVLCEESKKKEAKDAGADFFESEEIIKNINDGKIKFHKLVATPSMMPKMGKLGKILGPKGLMPNPKLGTVTQNISSAVKKAKSGQVQYKNDKSGIVHGGLGKLSFKDENLFENLKSFYEAIQKSKPESLKGSYIKKVTIASTMGFGLEVNTSDLH